ncbi:MAG TPA: ATP-grasp domain-containing protein [Candidatus Obscuribacterales bacterium]
MRKVLILCPTRREFRDLPELAKQLDCELAFDDFGGDYFDRFLGKNAQPTDEVLDIVSLIDETVAHYKDAGLSGATSGVGYPGMSASSLIAKKLGIHGGNPEPIITFDHKYYSRLAQQKYVPEATPSFYLIDPKDLKTLDAVNDFPAFLKPVKSCMSKNAYRISSKEELEKRVKEALLPEGFITPFNDMVANYTGLELHASYLLVESLLEGAQVSLEGYVHDGKVHVMGIVDALFFPGTISFKRFQYPSKLPEEVQHRMIGIAEKLMTGIGYDNAPFNIEMMYNPDSHQIHIIEVNPKLASQFPDLFLKVDGTSSYSVLLQLAIGEKPKFTRRQGEFKIAASCVLRLFEDQYVQAVPSQEQINALRAKYPDALIELYAPLGKNLSDQMQDAESFRYGLVNIGAQCERELEEKFEFFKGSLQFKFAPVHEPSASRH